MEKPKKAVRRGTEEYKILCAMLLQVWDESPITYKEAMIKNTGTKKKAIEFMVRMVNDGIIKIEGRTNKKGEFLYKLTMYDFDTDKYKDLNLRAKYIVGGG